MGVEDVLWQSYNINHGNQCHAVSKTSSAALRFPQDPGLFWGLGHLSTFKEVMVKYGQPAFQGARRARDIAFGGGLACTLISLGIRTVLALEGNTVSKE